MKPSPEIRDSVKNLLAYHADVIARDPVAARSARRLQNNLKAGRLENPRNPKRRAHLLEQGRLCGIHLAFEACLDSLFAAA